MEVLDYIREHVAELHEEVDDATDHADMIYLEGAIEALEHILIKFGVDQ